MLKHDGRVVIFTATRLQMKGYWLNHYFPLMLAASIAQMPSLKVLIKAVMEAGFLINGTEKHSIHDDLQDHFLYAGKNRPEIYLDGDIRKNISSFSVLSNSADIETGLSKLKRDLSLRKFDEIKERFNNGAGDYLFVTLEKKKSLG